jgi:hypothetical protein
MAKHWLDKLGPRVQHGIENLARKWWIKSLVESRRKPGQDLEAVADGYSLQLELEESFTRHYKRYARNGMDARSLAHVSCASLCLATYSCLSPYVPRDRLLEIIREQTGQRGKPVFQALLKVTSFLMPYSAMQNRLKLLASDRGPEFDSKTTFDARISTLRFSSCIYESIFREESKPELLSCVCCTADRFWLESQNKYKAGLKMCKAEGNDECLFFVINR